jgi:ABC-2 type transport system permease protein
MSSNTQELVQPGLGRGLADVARSRFLLSCWSARNSGPLQGFGLGLLWSYVKPGVQFIVFYIALGVFLGLEKSGIRTG